MKTYNLFQELVYPANNHIEKNKRGKLTFNAQYVDGRVEQRVIDMPTIYPNSITKLKGSFTPNGSLNFDVEYENEMGEIIYEEEF